MGKRLTVFLFLDKNICCGYSLEAPRWGASNEYTTTYYVFIEKYRYFLVEKAPYQELWWWYCMSHNKRKCTFWHVLPTKIQISLCIPTVWSASSLSAWRNFASLAIQNVLSEDSDQTVWVHRLIWIFTGSTCLKLHLCAEAHTFGAKLRKITQSYH